MYPPSANNGIAGSMGEVVRRYASPGTALTGVPSPQNSRSAAPPIAAWIGMPIAVATSSTMRAGVTRCATTDPGNAAHTAAAARPEAAHNRPARLSAACHTRRAVIAAKPSGSTSRTNHEGMPQATMSPAARSIWTTSALA